MLSIIACISKNRAIGYQNQLLYHIKSDMARFKELTMGHTIIMGRKTYESLPKGALPHRRNIVVSKTQTEIPRCEVFPSLEEAIHEHDFDSLFCSTKEETWMVSSREDFIIGGESIYRQALPLADRLYITEVDDEPKDADTFFPEIDLREWKVTEKEMRNENGLSFSFLTYERSEKVGFSADFPYLY